MRKRVKSALPWGLAVCCVFLAGCPGKRKSERDAGPTVTALPRPTPFPVLRPPETLERPGRAPVAAEISPAHDAWEKNVWAVALGGIQRELAEDGYPTGVADGTWGPQTESALREFQRDRELPATGLPDRMTLGRLFAGEDEPEVIQRVRGREPEVPAARTFPGAAGAFGGGLGIGLLLAAVLLLSRRWTTLAA